MPELINRLWIICGTVHCDSSFCNSSEKIIETLWNQRFCSLAIFVPGDRLLLIDKFPTYNTNTPISTTINKKKHILTPSAKWNYPCNTLLHLEINVAAVNWVGGNKRKGRQKSCTLTQTKLINNIIPWDPNGIWINSPWGWKPNGLLTQRQWG